MYRAKGIVAQWMVSTNIYFVLFFKLLNVYTIPSLLIEQTGQNDWVLYNLMWYFVRQTFLLKVSKFFQHYIVSENQSSVYTMWAAVWAPVTLPDPAPPLYPSSAPSLYSIHAPTTPPQHERAHSPHADSPHSGKSQNTNLPKALDLKYLFSDSFLTNKFIKEDSVFPSADFFQFLALSEAYTCRL